MSSGMNVLPTAPQYGETEKLYPVLTASNFRLQKISDVQKELEAEAAHYRQVAKKKNKKGLLPLPTAQLLAWLL